jgi:hypothetical protein
MAEPGEELAMDTRRLVTVLCTAPFFAIACERESLTTSESAAANAAPITGMYEVSGETVETATRDKREISGKVVLTEDGANYTATFHLSTAFPAGEGVLPAEVIGQGSGTIDGRELTGVSETQIVVTTVPGIDPAFAFIPRTTTTRIVSNSTATFAADGSVVIELTNKPAEGESYAPSRTTLRGSRVNARIGGGEAQPVAAAAE